MDNQFTNFSKSKKKELIDFFNESKDFNEKLGTWNTNTVIFGLSEGVRPLWSIPYPVTKLNNVMFKIGINLSTIRPPWTQKWIWMCGTLICVT